MSKSSSGDEREAAPRGDGARDAVLEGRHVRLEPLEHRHAADLAEVAFDPDLWWFTPTQIDTPADLRDYIDTAIERRRTGDAIPFATIDRSTGKAIGSTRLAEIDREHRRAEIGWTWLGRPYHRRAFNTEAKLLLFAHAFEVLRCVRVEFLVDTRNARSRAAVRRLGAVEEGTLRHRYVLPDGTPIDWSVFSVLRDEWPSVRERLAGLLAAHDDG